MLKDYESPEISIFTHIGESLGVIIWDSDDTVNVIRKKIENSVQIPEIYQMLYVDNPIGYEYIGEDICLPVQNHYLEGKEFIDHSMNVSPVDLTYGIWVFNVIDYIESQEDLLLSISEPELMRFYRNIILAYWPQMSFPDFRNVMSGNLSQPIKHELGFREDREIQKLKKITKVELAAFKFQEPLILYEKYRSINRNRFNLIFIFDQFPIDGKYSTMYLKIDESKVFKKQYARGESIYIKIPKTPSIFINDENRLFPDGSFQYTHKDFIKTLENILDLNLIETSNIQTYVFKLFLNGYVDFNMLNSYINSFPDYIERDYKNYSPKSYVSFYYKKASSYKSDSLQTGIFITISGDRSLDVTVHDVIAQKDIVNIFNFIIRMIFLYNKFHFGTGTPGTRKNNLKKIDPILFMKHDKTVYSRVCQSKKQPVGYFKGPGTQGLEYRNFTFPTRTSVYTCPRKEFPYPVLIPMDTICVPCCAKKNKFSGFCETERKENVFNLYYIRKFKVDREIPSRKLSQLPKLLHKFLNSGCIIKQNTLALGSSCYLLMGTPEIPEVNYYIMAVEGQKITLANFFESGEIDKFAYYIKTKFGNYPIVRLKLRGKKHYTYKLAHSRKSKIYLEFRGLIEKIIQRATAEEHPNLTDIVRMGIPFEQIRMNHPYENYVANVKIVGIKFPIIISILNVDYTTTTDIPRNSRANVDKALRRMQMGIRNSVTNHVGKMIGYRLRTGYMILFTEVDADSGPTEILHYTESPPKDISTSVDDIYEIYYLMLLHISRRLNVSDQTQSLADQTSNTPPNKTPGIISLSEWEKKLIQKYGSRTDSRFIHDYVLAKEKKYNEMTYFKEFKNQMMAAKTVDDVRKILAEMDIFHWKKRRT